MGLKKPRPSFQPPPPPPSNAVMHEGWRPTPSPSKRNMNLLTCRLCHHNVIDHPQTSGSVFVVETCANRYCGCTQTQLQIIIRYIQEPEDKQ